MEQAPYRRCPASHRQRFSACSAVFLFWRPDRLHQFGKQMKRVFKQCVCLRLYPGELLPPADHPAQCDGLLSGRWSILFCRQIQ